MISELKYAIGQIGGALWFRPAVCSLFALMVTLALALVDSLIEPSDWPWLPEIDVATVRGFLDLAAGSMLTVITVTLSVLMLVLSLVAGQASPRAVPELMADPVTQNALGTFLATFVFSIASLLSFGLDFSTGVGVTLTFCVALVYVAAVIKYFIQWIGHVANSLKLNRMIEKIHANAARVLDAYLSSEDGEQAEAVTRAGRSRTLRSDETGYIQYIDLDLLERIAEEKELTILVHSREGAFVHPRQNLLEVYGLDEEAEETERRLVQSVVIGFERSHNADPLLGIELLAEIACRALSPGINDPQTAITSVQFLGSLLCRASTVPPEDFPTNLCPRGRVELERPDFDRLLKRAFPPVLRDGAKQIEVLTTIMEALVDLTRCCDPAYLPGVEELRMRTLEAGESTLMLQADRRSLQDEAERLRAEIAERSPGG